MPTTNTVQTIFTADGAQLRRESASAEKSVADLSAGIRAIAAPVAAIAGVYSLGAVVKSVTEQSIQYLGKLETANLGIASSFMVGGKYIDQTTGKALLGQQALAAAQNDAVITMEQLQVANMQTIATLDQLVQAYQTTLPIAMAKGFDRTQVQEFTVAVVQAAGAIGVPMNQLGQELRALLTGDSWQDARIGQVLGLRPADINRLKGDADQLFAMLMDKLSAYKIAGAAAQQSLDGLWSNTKDIALQAGGQAFQPLFEVIKYELTEITGHMVTIDEKTKKINWHPDFISGVQTVKGGVNSMVAEGYRFSMLLDKIGGDMTSVGYTALKTAEIVTRFMTIGQYGNNLGKWAEDMAKWNKDYQARYAASDKALQDLANREVGIAGETKAKVDAIYRQNAAGKSDEQLKAEKKAAAERVKQAKADAKLVSDAQKEAAVEYAADMVATLKIIAAAEHDARMEHIAGVLADIKLVEDAKQEELAQSIEFSLQRIQLEEQTQRAVGDLRSANQVALLLAAGNETGALEAQYARKFQLLDDDYQKQIDHARQIGMDTLAIDQEFGAKREQLQQEQAQRQADLWWNGAQTYINFAQQMTTMGMQLLLFDESQRSQIGKRMLATSVRFLGQGLQQYMFTKAKEHLLAAASAAGQTSTQVVQHSASLAMLETEAIAWAAFYTANSLNPYGGQAFIPAATAMSAVAGGVIPSAIAATAAEGAASVSAELAMAAAWGAGGILAGSLGEAGASAIEGGTSGSTTAAGYGAGSPASPVVTQSAATAQRSLVVNVHFPSAVIIGSDKDQVARDLTPYIRKAISDGV